MDVACVKESILPREVEPKIGKFQFSKFQFGGKKLSCGRDSDGVGEGIAFDIDAQAWR